MAIPRALKFVLIAGLLAGFLLARQASAAERDFNEGWSFQKSEAAGIEAVGFDDSTWRKVDLPHDWSVEDLPSTVATAVGPFDRALKDGQHVGYLRGGIGWYRKRFVLGAEDSGKTVVLLFDGVQDQSEVWINGHLLGAHSNGYIPVSYDLTAHLNASGQANILVVKAINPEQNSRWHPGSGIYRHVSLHVSDHVHIPVWGVRVETQSIGSTEATLQIGVQLRNNRASPAELAVEINLVASDGTALRQSLGHVTVAAGAESTLEKIIAVKAPKLWSMATPQLYRAEVQLLENGSVTDEYVQPFGIRTVTVSATDGLRINGEQVRLKGGCLHHDNGLLGAAAFPGAEYRRVALMKANGFNAIRTSHNPPSAAFLDACDQLGVVVIDEFVDMWEKAKRPNDYSKYFNQDWPDDLKSFVLRDRNHPSVIFWSIGNEIPERGLPAGLATAQKLVEAVRVLDRSRPVTHAICGFWENPEWSWDRSAPAFALLDAGGYNYETAHYATDHAAFPERVIIGTESFAKKALESWRPVASTNYVIGDFVWTGMDHIGESGIGHTRYLYGDEPEIPHILWPNWISWAGDLDITGVKKPQSYYRDIVWDRSVVELAVHAPVPAAAHEMISNWGWPDEYQSWTWSGHEGVLLSVNVYTKAPCVRLELNGKVIGEMAASQGEGITATFEVPYQPGTLKAVALKNDVEVGVNQLQTAGVPAAIRLRPESKVVAARRSELIFVPIEIVDKAGQVVPMAASRLNLAVEGGAEVIAFGNGSPTLAGSLQDKTSDAFRGRALAILRSTGNPGAIVVTVTAAGLEPATVRLEAR